MLLVFFGCVDWFGFGFNWWLLVDLRLLGLFLVTVVCFDYLIVLVGCDSLCLIVVWLFGLAFGFCVTVG